MDNSKINTLCFYLRAHKYLAYYCDSSSFVKPACFLWAMSCFNTHSLPSLYVFHFFRYLFLSVYIIAFALLCISSAGFEAIGVYDHNQTRPEKKVWGKEKDR